MLPAQETLFLLAMKNIFLLLFLAVSFFSCDRVKRTAKDSISKTGQTVGKGTSEFFDGVADGVDQTFQSKLQIAEPVAAAGLKAGKFAITNSPQGPENLLTAYLIFEQSFQDTLIMKVYDRSGKEYGRSKKLISGKKGEAAYYDFTFDPRTRIERKSKFVLEPAQ